jgi:hypothetical protein
MTAAFTIIKCCFKCQPSVHASNSSLYGRLLPKVILPMMAQSGHSDLISLIYLSIFGNQLYKDNHNMAIVYNRMGQIDLFENRLNES